MKRLICVLAIVVVFSANSFAQEKLAPTNFDLLNTELKTVKKEVQELKKRVEELEGIKKVVVAQREVAPTAKVKANCGCSDCCCENCNCGDNCICEYVNARKYVQKGNSAFLYVGKTPATKSSNVFYTKSKSLEKYGISDGVYQLKMYNGEPSYEEVVASTYTPLTTFFPANQSCPNGNCPYVKVK